MANNLGDAIDVMISGFNTVGVIHNERDGWGVERLVTQTTPLTRATNNEIYCLLLLRHRRKTPVSST